MKAYFVCSWSGEYERYDEYDKRYFLNEASAKKYEQELEEKHQKSREKYRLPNGYDMYHGGVIYEEIEMIED